VWDIIADIELLTRKDGDSKKVYIDKIFQNHRVPRQGGFGGDGVNVARYVKLADRLHNLRSLPKSGNSEKIQKYIRETEEVIMPWRKEKMHEDCEVFFLKIEEQLQILKKCFD
jgi:hypothetical protein